jgi:hypothetical protein
MVVARTQSGEEGVLGCYPHLLPQARQNLEAWRKRAGPPGLCVGALATPVGRHPPQSGGALPDAMQRSSPAVGYCARQKRLFANLCRHRRRRGLRLHVDEFACASSWRCRPRSSIAGLVMISSGSSARA